MKWNKINAGEASPIYEQFHLKILPLTLDKIKTQIVVGFSSHDGRLLRTSLEESVIQSGGGGRENV